MRRSGLITSREELIEAGWGYVADSHRASLTVESTPLKGSVFQIAFPLPKSLYRDEPRTQTAP